MADMVGQNQDIQSAYQDATGIASSPPLPGFALIRFCLAEDHPGRGIVFDIYLGVWDSSAHKWLYPDCTIYKCIDWDYGVPTPDTGARGFGMWKASDTHGQILHVLTMDCDTPGVCC